MRRGEQKDFPHGVEFFVGEAPGVVVVPGKRAELAQQRGNTRPFFAVAVPENQLLLAHITGFGHLLFERFHFDICSFFAQPCGGRRNRRGSGRL